MIRYRQHAGFKQKDICVGDYLGYGVGTTTCAGIVHGILNLSEEQLYRPCRIAGFTVPDVVVGGELHGSDLCWMKMRTRTKRTQETKNPDAFIRLNIEYD
jgi:hypothetical protein